MQKTIFSFICLLMAFLANAQYLTPQDYIETYKDMAIREQKRMGIPASITLAQGLLETENGNSILVKKSNNHFGIKCKSNWTGESVSHTDDAPNECFRKYNSAEESYRDRSEFLKNSSRYAFLFKLDPSDYKGWAYGLKKAGYATNPRYPEILMKHIEKYNLHQYDLVQENNSLFDEGKVLVNQEEKTIAISPVSLPKEAIADVEKTVPVGKTMVNGLKAVYVKAGTSLLAIASSHKVNLSKLLEYNDLEKDGLVQADQYIYLEKKMKQGKMDYYTTTQKENLYDISQLMGIQLQELAAYNQVSRESLVGAGSKLALKPGLQPSIKTASLATVTHTVAPREGLFAIARKYNVTVDDIKNWNNLPGESLKPGQQLLISKN